MTGGAVHIVGMGASTPVGRNVWASAAAIRAGLCGFREHPFMIDTAGEPMRVALAPWLPVEVGGAERLAELLLPAIAEALQPLETLLARPSERPRLGLALGLPPPRAGLPEDLIEQMKARLTVDFGAILSNITAVPIGHAAGLCGLDAAVKSLGNGRLDACLVAGVDSYAAPETLEWLEDCDQLHGAGPENNAWGFIPGEAAGTLLLASASLVSRGQLSSLGCVRSVGLGTEKNCIKTDTVCIGEGLTEAFSEALTTMPHGTQIQNVFCDMNGEAYRADEYGFTTLRTKEWFVSAGDFVAPADCWGDVGAAGGPLHIALALVAHRKRYGRGPLSFIWASSEGGARAAAVVQALDPRVS